MATTEDVTRRYKRLLPGDRLPAMTPPCGTGSKFAFDNLAGRYQLFGFFLSLDLPGARELIDAVLQRADLFDDLHCAFAGVSVAPRDRHEHGLANREPGIRFAWDFSHAMSQACGVVPMDSRPGEPMPAHRCWLLVDPSLHVMQVFPMTAEGLEAALAAVAQLPPPDAFGELLRPAPILVLPNVFDGQLCRRFIAYYEAAGGEESGVHRDGRGVLDPSFKRRKDCTVTDEALLEDAKWAIVRRVLPEVERLFFMRARYIERFIVGCYSADHGGHFSPHTDNGPGITAHRRFAVSVNLNDDFEGGEVVFPEYNMAGYKAPAGWAIIFPCAALHAVRRVTRGARYAFLPFLYDDAGLAIREAEQARAP